MTLNGGAPLEPSTFDLDVWRESIEDSKGRDFLFLRFLSRLYPRYDLAGDRPSDRTVSAASSSSFSSSLEGGKSSVPRHRFLPPFLSTVKLGRGFTSSYLRSRLRERREVCTFAGRFFEISRRNELFSYRLAPSLPSIPLLRLFVFPRERGKKEAARRRPPLARYPYRSFTNGTPVLRFFQSSRNRSSFLRFYLFCTRRFPPSSSPSILKVVRLATYPSAVDVRLKQQQKRKEEKSMRRNNLLPSTINVFRCNRFRVPRICRI